MALQKEYSDTRGFTAPTAYFRITSVEGNWGHKRAIIKVSVFRDEAARDAGLSPMSILKFDIHEQNGWNNVLDITVLSAPTNNPVRTVYAWLKLQPEFIGAIDV